MGVQGVRLHPQLVQGCASRIELGFTRREAKEERERKRASGKKEGIFVYYNLFYKCSTNYSKQKYPLFCLMVCYL